MYFRYNFLLGIAMLRLTFGLTSLNGWPHSACGMCKRLEQRYSKRPDLNIHINIVTRLPNIADICADNMYIT